MKLGFVGMGNMAQALAEGFVRQGALAAGEIAAYAPHQKKLAQNAARIGFVAAQTAEDAVAGADFVVLAVKPDKIESVIKGLGDALSGKAVLSVALGYSHEKLSALLPQGARARFIMPNTPAAVGEGVFLFEETHSLAPSERAEAEALFSSLGTVISLSAAQMGIGGAIAGCGPAFVDMMIEAFADAGVRYGLPRDKALAMTSQMILGSAKLQLVTGKHPGELKDAVCSPGGSTIRGVAALENAGFRSNCISAITAIMEK